MNERVKHDGAVWPWIVGAAILATALSVGTYYFFQMTSKPPKLAVPAAPAFKEVTGVTGGEGCTEGLFPDAGRQGPIIRG